MPRVARLHQAEGEEFRDPLISKASIEDNALAQKFFQQAIDLDPSFAGGYKGLAGAQGTATNFQGRGLFESLNSIEALARRAVEVTSGRLFCRKP